MENPKAIYGCTSLHLHLVLVVDWLYMAHYLEEMKINSMDEEKNTLTLFQKRMKDLLDELDEHMENVGSDYGPILMNELQNRLEQVVKNFNNEVHNLVAKSFNEWKVIDSQLREFVKNSITIPDNKTVKDKKKVSTPQFIKNIDFGPIRSK